VTLKVAVIGVGAMGSNHARLFWELPGVDFVGVADENKERAESIAKRYLTNAYSNYKQLFDEQKPDAITIAVPTAYHLDVALEAIHRGIHIFVEKPISLTLAQGQQIIKSAKDHKVCLMVGHIERFNPAIQMLKGLLDQGALGKVFQMEARRQGPFPARIDDVGVVIDLAVHDVDIMCYLTGNKIRRVYAETEKRIHSKHEDLLVGLMRFQDGEVGTLLINWLTPTKVRELWVIGEKGMFKVDYLTQDLFFYENLGAKGAEWETLQILRGVSEGQMVRYSVQKKEPLRSELEAYLAAVRGEIPVAVSGEDGLRALRIALAIIESGKKNQPIIQN
jgi:UDP-N-acetylglucosamine 3-dehydrogenase